LDICSDVFWAPSSVPQVGHSSPILLFLFVNSASKVLSHSRLLCFADYMKMFRCLYKSTLWKIIIGYKVKLIILLNGLSHLAWRLTSKNVIQFHSPKKWPYKLSIISRIDSIVYLGFKFNNCLIPGPQIDMICCKTYRILEFIKRLVQDFKLGLSLKPLYYTLVRPILEYGISLWDSHTSGQSWQIKMVQRKFFSFAGFILHIQHLLHGLIAPLLTYLTMKNFQKEDTWMDLNP